MLTVITLEIILKNVKKLLAHILFIMPPPVRNLQDPVILASLMSQLRLPPTFRPVI